jgi:septal ring factor EnvC (AmiA/AmiB activator)
MSHAEKRRMPDAVKVFLATLALLLGCSSGELDKLRGELKACGDRRDSLARDMDACRKESARLKQRLQSIQTVLAAPVPASVNEAKQEFLANVPQEVRVELELQLDSYFTAVAREFKELQDRNKEILQEMKSARREISQEISKTSGQVEQVATATSNLEEGLAAVQKGAEEAQQLRQRQQQTAAELQRILESVIEFDRNKLNCRNCKDKLRLRDKNREEILKFHSSLIQKLTALQASAEGAAQ